MKEREGKEERVTFKDMDRCQAHSCRLPIGRPTRRMTQTCIQTCPCGHDGCNDMKLFCACVSGSSTTHTKTPVLPQPVIRLSSKPATTGEDNSFVSCCRPRHYPTTHPVTACGERGGGGGERAPLSLLFVFFSLFCFSLSLSPLLCHRWII